MKKTTQLRKLIETEPILQAPGVFNPILAKLVQQAGFPVVYVSGAGLANGNLGLPDVGILNMTEVTTMAARIADAVDLPVICDADTGYGGRAMIRRAIVEFIKHGIAAVHIEDQVSEKRCGHLPGKQLIATEDMQQRLQAATEGRTCDPDFVLIARTDARSVEGIDAAIERAKSYVTAGADVIFAEALESVEEFKTFTDAISVPVLANMTEFGKSPLLSVDELQKAGVKIIIYPQTCLRLMMKTVEDALKEIKKSGTQKGLLDQMQTRQQLYDLLEYDDWKE